jgi:serine/threonine-protein kinase
MLTGELPYEAEDPIATAMKHLDEPPPHPRKLNPEVPEGLDALVVKLLAKEPEDRYASAATLAEDLRRVRDGLPPLAAGLAKVNTVPLQENLDRTRTAPTMVAPGGAQRDRGQRRRYLPLIAALLAGAALLGGIAWALTQLAPNPAAFGSVEVPKVVGLPREVAQRKLEGAGLKVGTLDQRQSAEVAEGVVIDQNPHAGTQAVRGAAVDLTISSGPAQNPITTASPSATSSASSSATSSSATSSSSASSSSSTPPAPPASNAEPQKAQEDQKGKGEAAKESKKEPKKQSPGGPEPHKKSPQKSPSEGKDE